MFLIPFFESSVVPLVGIVCFFGSARTAFVVNSILESDSISQKTSNVSVFIEKNKVVYGGWDSKHYSNRIEMMTACVCISKVIL
jgi:hypothetical protein